uniref:FXYD domain-containing ion transport regulator n=1 Tax=Steinernema glaseri TaxID=37863 RepID=A0A1I8APS8_9BILA
MRTLSVLVFVAVLAVALGELTAYEKNLEQARLAFNVYQFPGTDYPATFAIFAGLILILALALIFIVAGMVSMDPGKDSIIYRMTTTRMKKD